MRGQETVEQKEAKNECIVGTMELQREQKSKKDLMYTEHYYISERKQYTTTYTPLTVLPPQLPTLFI